MFERIRNGVIKSGGRRTLRRGTAMALCFCMIVTIVPLPLPTLAKEADEDIVLSGFAVMPNSVKEQTVPVGTPLEELNLPDTIKAFMYSVAEEPMEPVEKTTVPAKETSVPETEAESEETSVPETEAESESEETSVPETETGSEEASVPETETESEEASASTTKAENEKPSEDTVTFSVNEKQFRYLAMPDSENIIDPVAVTVTGVTWECDPAYDGEAEGKYIFTAVLPTAYIVEEGVSLPEIMVTVKRQRIGDMLPEMVAELLVLIDALPEPSDVLKQSDKSWRADVEAAEAARAALTDEQRAALPEDATQKLDTLLHFLDVPVDCPDLGCPWHYSSELLERMNENETPALLTLEDLMTDYDVQPTSRLFAARTAANLNPQTLMVTSDNENNVHTGMPDADLDRMFNFWDSSHPIEVRFDLDQVPSQSAYLAIKALDIDELDGVYVNGTSVGVLAGESDKWSTTVLKVPTSLLKTGKNYVTVKLDSSTYVDLSFKEVPKYSARVDWMQLILDGGAADSNIESFKIELGEFLNSGEYEQIPVTATITQSGTTQYIIEYALTSHIIIDTASGRTSGTDSATFRLSRDKSSRLYTVTAVVKDPVTEVIKARDEAVFYHIEGVGAELPPKITHTITPDAPTNQDVQVEVTVEDAMGYEVEVRSGSRTVSSNQECQIYVTYRAGDNAGERVFVYPVSVNNIDKTPPVIEYTPFSVEEGTVDAEVKRLFEAALRVTEDKQLAGEPRYTLPEDFAKTMGEKNVVVTVSDMAGNTVSKDCTVTVLPLSARLTQKTPERVDATNSFTLSATLEDTGGLAFTETGFVWGVMQNPTVRICNGRLATSVPVTTRGSSVTVTAQDIVEGVDYYARAYAFANGRAYYSDQMKFAIGEKKYGAFSVVNNGDNTFTITRANGFAEAQTVYYRTVNGSAIGGTHFTHLADCVVFAQGETSKKVTVKEAAVDAIYGDKASTGYSNANRTYQLELYKVEGGGTIDAGGALAIRTMEKNEVKTIHRGIYDYREVKSVTTKDGDDNYRIYENEEGGYEYTAPISELTSPAVNGNIYIGAQAAYVQNTATAMRFQLRDFTARDDTWTMQRYILFNTAPVAAKFLNSKGAALPDLPYSTKCALIYSRQGDTNSAETTTFNFPHPDNTSLGTGSSTNKAYAIRDAKWAKDQDETADYVLYNLNETCYISLGSYNSAGANSYFIFNSARLVCAPHDTREPQVLGIAPMAGGLYKPGDSITVSVVFDEIVDSQNSSLSGTTIDTNYGTMTYAGGADTTVLYYTGKVPVGAAGTVILNSFSNASGIRDMCPDKGTESTVSGSTSITVDGVEPTVKINYGGIKDGTATGTITADRHDLLQYTWTQSSAMPVTGWLTCASGDDVQTRQASGTWYLHALATRSANGATGYAKQSFNFGTPDNPVSPLPELTLAADNTSWAHSRDITVTRTPDDAVVVYSGPQSGTAEGTTVSVTQNGLYTFTLESGDETIIQQILVTRLDTVAPTLAIQESGNTDAVYNELNIGVSASDSLSGIARVEYGWSDTTTPGGWTTVSGTGSTYIIPTYTATETTQSTKYLHVRATDHAGNMTTQVSQGYTVVKALTPAQLPAITLTGAPSAWTKGPVNLRWRVTQQGAGEISVNVGETGSTADNGLLSVNKNGVYNVMVMDKNRNSASAECLVNYIDAEAPILASLSCTPGWAREKTVTVSGVSDYRTPVFDTTGTITGYGGSGLAAQEWKLGDGSYTKFTGDSFPAEKNGTYTVRLTDKVGNQNEYPLLVLQIDSTAPHVEVENPDAGWTNEAQNIKVTYTDEAGGSGISKAQYKIVSDTVEKPETGLGDLPASHGSVTVTTNGTSYIYYKITDHAGNVTDGYSGPIKVDTQVPSLTVTGAATGAASQTLTVTHAFGASGGKVTVSRDGGPEADFTGSSYDVTAKGTYVFKAVSNAGKTKSVTKKIYGVTFDSMGGTPVTSQIVAEGGKAAEPGIPEKKGYTFVKWQKNNSADYDFHTPITADIILTAVWTLDAPAVRLTVDHKEVTYNGGSTVATLTATPRHDVAGVTYTYQWYRDGKELQGKDSTLPLTDAAHSGSYTVKVTASDGTLVSLQAEGGPLTVTIQKADTSIATVPTANGITYGQALRDSMLTGGTGMVEETTFLGRIAHVFQNGEEVPGDFSWTMPETTPAVSDSGTTGYSVTFTPTDTANYNTSTATITLTVGQKTLIPSVNAVSDKIYDGSTVASGTITLTGAVFGESPVASGIFAFTDKNAGENKRVDVTEIKLADAWDDNYVLDKSQLSNVASTAAVVPKTIDLIWSGHTGLVYDTEAVSVTAAAGGLVSGDSCRVTVIDGSKTDAGTYTARATALSNSNYALPAVPTQTYTIAKAPVTFTVKDNVHDYDKLEKNAVVDQTTGETPNVSGKFTVSYEQEGIQVSTPVNAGVYDVMVTLNDANFKHNGIADTERKSKVGILTIDRVIYPPYKDGTMTWPTAESLIYGALLSDSSLEGGSETAKGVYTWTEPTTRPTVANRGYLVTFTPDDASYAPVQQEVEITVTPKELTIFGAIAATRSYIPENTTVAVSGGSLQGVETGDDVVLEETGASGQVSTPDAGNDKEVTVTGYAVTGAQTDNYTLIQPENITVDITPAIGIGSVAMDDWTYGDTAGSPVPDSATNGVGNVSYSYAGTDAAGAAYGPSDICPTAAGSYVVTATYAATTNYREVTATASFVIAKRPLTLRWSNLYHTYDGSEASPMAQLVNRAAGDEDEQCAVILNGMQGNVNAGSYTITAALTGTASFNYTLPAKHTEILVIKPAPVTFTVNNYSYQQDGSPKEAHITSVPDVAHAVIYRLAGEEVISPAATGEYDIIVELSDANYRFADGVDGKPRKIGVLTIYENKPPQTYTIQFESGTEDAQGIAPTLPAAVAGTIHLLPDNTFTCAGFVFAGWKHADTVYQPQEHFTQPANNNTVFIATWKESIYKIGGIVKQDGQELANVKVVLMRGAEQVAETVTDQRGEYTFTSVLPGLYNLVAAKPAENGDIIQTIKVEVTNADVNQADITIPLGLTNSVVEVSAGTPKIIVGNLEQTFENMDDTVYTENDHATVQEGGAVEIRFLAEQKEGGQLNETEIKELAETAGRAKIGLYLSLDIQKTVTQGSDFSNPNISSKSKTTFVTESNVLLEMVIPLPRQLQGKHGYSVVRMHDNMPDMITGTPNGDGEFFEVNAEKTTMTLHAKKFSTYAIAYTEKSIISGSGSDDDDYMPIPKKQPEIVQPEIVQPETVQAETGQQEETAKYKDASNQEKPIQTETTETADGQPDSESEPQDGKDTEGSSLTLEEQPEQEKEGTPNKQEQEPEHGTASQPFVLLSAALALTGLAGGVFTVVRKKKRRCRVISVAASIGAMAVFLLTTGWSGFALADIWTIPVAALTIAAVRSAFDRSSEK